MLSRCIGAAVILAVLGGFVVAGSFRGTITKTDLKDGVGTITVKVYKKGEKKGDKGTSEEKTFKINTTTKITKKGKDKDAEPTTVKVDDFAKSVEDAAKSEGRRKGVGATIETKDDTDEVTSITIGGGRGKRGGGKRNKSNDSKLD